MKIDNIRKFAIITIVVGDIYGRQVKIKVEWTMNPERANIPEVWGEKENNVAYSRDILQNLQAYSM